MLSVLKEIDLSNAVIIDTETTGIGHNDEIIELAIICAKSGMVLFHDQFKPTCTISDEAFKIHRIKDYILQFKPRFEERFDDFISLLSDKIIIGWRVNFDIDMLFNTMKLKKIRAKLDCKALDLKVVYLEGRGFDADSVHLSTACEAEQIDMSDITAHRALDDCTMVYRLMKKILNEE